mmetsp:Transcript_73786/g.199576  ORF Transcript_73786/g.199576 Transcript_73786/m.199576 type:complete len:243 (+) Transcript_73786:301-1029(+)
MRPRRPATTTPRCPSPATPPRCSFGAAWTVDTGGSRPPARAGGTSCEGPAPGARPAPRAARTPFSPRHLAIWPSWRAWPRRRGPRSNGPGLPGSRRRGGVSPSLRPRTRPPAPAAAPRLLRPTLHREDRRRRRPAARPPPRSAASAAAVAARGRPAASSGPPAAAPGRRALPAALPPAVLLLFVAQLRTRSNWLVSAQIPPPVRARPRSQSSSCHRSPAPGRQPSEALRSSRAAASSRRQFP